MQKEEAVVADSLDFKHPVSLTTSEFQHFLSLSFLTFNVFLC